MSVCLILMLKHSVIIGRFFIPLGSICDLYCFATVNVFYCKHDIKWASKRHDYKQNIGYFKIFDFTAASDGARCCGTVNIVRRAGIILLTCC